MGGGGGPSLATSAFLALLRRLAERCTPKTKYQVNWLKLPTKVALNLKISRRQKIWLTNWRDELHLVPVNGLFESLAMIRLNLVEIWLKAPSKPRNSHFPSFLTPHPRLSDLLWPYVRPFGYLCFPPRCNPPPPT